MIIGVGLCVCLLTLVTCQWEIQEENIKGYNFGGLTDAEGIGLEGAFLFDTGFLNYRRRRSLSYLIKLGDEAADALLKGASKVLTRSKNYQKYVKDGTAETALKEFDLLKPTIVRKYESRHGEDVVVGRVGQRTITLKMADRTQEGSPSILIYDPRRGLSGYDKIVYQNRHRRN